MSADAFYITTPIYYVNGEPHIGHAYTTIAADTASRWARLLGRPTRFLTGTDEHGQKVLDAATARGMSPKEHCDDLVRSWKAMMEQLGIQYDRFIRTTDADHEAVVQGVLADLWARGEIYEDQYVGWYLVKDEVFVTEKEKDERIAKGELEERHFRQIEERNYFFRMSKYQQPLLDHIEAHPDFIQPANRRNEVLGFLRQPLSDLCISRPKSRMSWGIELPFDRDFVTYVWFDALLNYLTGAGYPNDGWQAWWPASAQLLGKDILTTHSVYWTTMLMAMGVPLPRRLMAHGWWVSADGGKIGKSEGNAIDVRLLTDAFGVDAARFFFLREIRFGADGGFSYEGFLNRYNADLANDLGNLAHRALSMTEKWFAGVIPDRASPSPELEALARSVVQRGAAGFDELQFKDALDALFELVAAGNKHIDAKQPWALFRDGKLDELGVVMRDMLEVCALVAAFLAPVIPAKAAELSLKLGMSVGDASALVRSLVAGAAPLQALQPGLVVRAGDPLFPRFREMPESIASLFAPPAEAPAAPPPLPELPWIDAEDFTKVQLRVGLVLHAEPHPQADRLMVLQVDVGEARPRTICAGVRARFGAEQLVGRTVVVVVNLRPRMMRKIMSEGMILAAGGETVIDLVSVDAKPGDVVR
jgi:methionyl-tRNA synthetase